MSKLLLFSLCSIFLSHIFIGVCLVYKDYEGVCFKAKNKVKSNIQRLMVSIKYYL